MRQDGTRYRPVLADADHAAAARFQRDQGEAPTVLVYPSVIAERDRVIIGLLGTTPTNWSVPYNGVVLMGPLTIKRASQPVVVVALRLMQVYESLLEVAGVQGAVFIVDPQNIGWVRLLERRGFSPYAHTDAGDWYIRRIGIAPILRIA